MSFQISDVIQTREGKLPAIDDDDFGRVKFRHSMV